MKNSIKILFLMMSVLMMSAFALQTQSYTKIANIEEIKSKIVKKASETENIHSDFDQEKHMMMFNEVIKSKGVFYFSKPNKLRWEYYSPIRYIIVLDGKQVQIQDQSKVKTFDLNSNPIFKEVNKLMISSFNGDILNSKDFKVEYYQSSYDYMAKLRPLNSAMANMIETIEIYFNKTDFGVTGLKIVEVGNDYTLIKFQNRIINGKLSTHIFTL
jgi:outer membrane lipoprotein carrier protein